MAKILVVEDDTSLLAVVERVLRDEKYVVDTVSLVDDARAYLKSVQYDLVVLDWNLPDGSGMDLCHEYRKEGGATPILFLTGHDSVNDKITGLDAGADDYLTKPFEVRELLSRVRAILRRPPQVKYRKLTARDLEMDPVKHTVTRADEVLKLYPKEFSLLELFLLHPQQVFSVDDLLNRVWPTDAEASVETVRQTILRLRQKVETDKNKPLIQTVRGVGYRLEP